MEPFSQPVRPGSADRAFLRFLLGGSGLLSAVLSCCFALVPLIGLVPAAVLFVPGLFLSVSSLLISRLAYKTWDLPALAGLCFSLLSVMLAVAVNFLFIWGMEQMMEGVVRLLEWFVSPLEDYPGF